MNRAEQRAADGGVRVRVAAARNRVRERVLHALGAKQLPQRVLERHQNPARLREIIRRRLALGGSDGGEKLGVRNRLFGAVSDGGVQLRRADARSDSARYGGGVQAVGVYAHLVGMRDFGVRPRPFFHTVVRVGRAEYGERAYTHHRAVGLAGEISASAQSGAYRVAIVERTRIEPADVGLPRLLLVVCAVAEYGSRQRERHFGIVRRLTGDGVPDAAVFHIADAVRIEKSYSVGILEFD